MCSYNKLNWHSTPLRTLGFNEDPQGGVGFEGRVVSDWGAVHDRVEALKAGLDLEMPGPRERRR